MKLRNKLITTKQRALPIEKEEKSGEIFMAMVTKTPIYEDGELVGVITVSSCVSSCAVVFNSRDLLVLSLFLVMQLYLTLRILKFEELVNPVRMTNLEFKG